MERRHIFERGYLPPYRRHAAKGSESEDPESSVPDAPEPASEVVVADESQNGDADSLQNWCATSTYTREDDDNESLSFSATQQAPLPVENLDDVNGTLTETLAEDHPSHAHLAELQPSEIRADNYVGVTTNFGHAQSVSTAYSQGMRQEAWSSLRNEVPTLARNRFAASIEGVSSMRENWAKHVSKPKDPMEEMFSNLENSKLFTTSTDYIGLGRSDVAKGDVVCIVFGCRKPLILRPDGNGSFYLLGSCFVNGIMDVNDDSAALSSICDGSCANSQIQGEFVTQLEQSGKLDGYTEVFNLI